MNRRLLPFARSIESTAIELRVSVDGEERILTLTIAEATRLANQLVDAAEAANGRLRESLRLDLDKADRDYWIAPGMRLRGGVS